MTTQDHKMPDQLYCRQGPNYDDGRPQYYAAKSAGILYDHVRYIRADLLAQTIHPEDLDRREIDGAVPMKAVHLKLARHALGLPNDQYRSYRNRFHVGPGCRNYADWMEMVQCGLADTDGLDSFWLTRAAAEAALEGHETLCSEAFPPDKRRGA